MFSVLEGQTVVFVGLFGWEERLLVGLLLWVWLTGVEGLGLLVGGSGWCRGLLAIRGLGRVCLWLCRVCLWLGGLPYPFFGFVAGDVGVPPSGHFSAIYVDCEVVNLTGYESGGYFDGFVAEEFEFDFLGVVAEGLGYDILALPGLSGFGCAGLDGENLDYFGLQFHLFLWVYRVRLFVFRLTGFGLFFFGPGVIRYLERVDFEDVGEGERL